MKLTKGSKVKILTGKHKNTVANVVSVNRKKDSVVLEGVNVKKRAIKKSESNNENFAYLQHGIHISNVKVVAEKSEVEVEAKDSEKEKKAKNAKRKSKAS
jgi:large subunit ribosomal protein L24